MDNNALQTIQRILVLEKFIKLGHRDKFIGVITNFIEQAVDKFEKDYLTAVLTKFNKDNITEAIEALGYLRINTLGKIFSSPCEKTWNSLIASDDEDVKFCSDCKRNVFKVYNKDDYRKRKQLNQCVAINYYNYEKVDDSIGCEISLTQHYELLGAPSTID